MKSRLKLVVSLFSIAAVLVIGGVASADDPPAADAEVEWTAPADVKEEVFAAGEKAYKKCKGCHGTPEKAGKAAPHLFVTMANWDQEDAEAQKAFRKATWEIIRDGVEKEVDGKKKKMPAFGEKLSDDERRAVIYYILKNRLPAEAPAE